MSFNSMKNLGADMTLGNVSAKTITCDSISILNPSNEDLTVQTITADTGNFNVIDTETLTSQTGNIETLTSQTTESSIITATETLLVSNNAMILNNTKNDSDIPLLGNSGSATVGQYLTEIYPDSTATYTLEQLAAGDNGSQSLIFTAGGGYQDPVRNTIQSYDSFRDTKQTLWLNPLGGDVKLKDSITAATGNFDVINVATLNVSNPDDPTIPTDLNVSSITATTGNIENLTSESITSTSASITSSLACNSLTSQSLSSDDITANEILKVSNNCMMINNTHIDSNLALLGNSGSETVGDYLNQIYPDSTDSYNLEQLAAGDNGSQSLIFTAGGGYQDVVRNTIQSYDSFRDTEQSLWLNPLGGKVITDNLTFTNSNKPVQAPPLSSSAMPNMEILFYHLTGSGSQATATMTLANNINGTTNYAVFPSLYYGYHGSGGTYSVFDSYFDINVSNFTSTQFYANFKKGSGDNANVYIQFLVIYDMVGTDFPKSY